MSAGIRRAGPFWRAREGRVVRPELWGLAIVVLGMLLVEVWQTSRMAELGIRLDHARATLAQERARLDYARARLDQDLTRTQQEPIAMRLGLAPMNGAQQIDLPADYLAGETTPATDPAAPRMAWLDRVARVLIPDATARSRTGS
jgi:hypothetical protein